MTKTKLSSAGEHDSIMPLSSILFLAGQEAGFLASKLAELDRRIGESIQDLGNAPQQGLQSADEVRQGLEGLARYLNGLAETVNAEITCDPQQATQSLALRGQIQRLLGRSDESSEDSKDIELWNDHPGF